MLHHDVTEFYLQTRRAEQRALHDPLTGLPNRLLLLDRLRQALRRAEPTVAARGAGLLAVDLDGFKRVNDRHGHAVGDGLMRLVGRRMVAALRGADTVALGAATSSRRSCPTSRSSLRDGTGKLSAPPSRAGRR